MQHSNKPVQPMDVKLSRSDTPFNIFGVFILVIALICSLYPLFWMVTSSFRTNNELFLNPLGMPMNFDFSIFKTVWNRANFTIAFRNSFLNLVGTSALVLIVSSTAAFAIARIRFPGSKGLQSILSASIIISGQLILIPLFFVLREIKIYNTLWATIVADAAMDLPICIILFITFFKDIPIEIEEAATIDGCGKYGFFLRFIIPLSKPIVSTVVIFVSLWTWNEYLFALTFLKDDLVRTIPLQLQNFRGRYAVEYNAIFASLTLAIIPMVVLYIVMQKSFVKGLTAGAIKA